MSWQSTHAGEWDEAGRVLEEAAAAVLQRAGAEAIVLCTNIMYSVLWGIAGASNLPLLHIAGPTAERIVRAGFRVVGLLGTRFTMVQDFLLRDAPFGLAIVVPDEEGLGAVHDIIYKDLCNGIVQENSRDMYYRVVTGLQAAGAECLILDCTGIGLLLDGKEVEERCGLPLLTLPKFMRWLRQTGQWRLATKTDGLVWTRQRQKNA
ncbi:hypothetical protein PG994_006551 [Apiospora phragmitis]|uniref:Aspartate/glutamate racemase family protein n=1 Tax=Apiospora phragmitis TaxID=2905665 RepID=A0ABR1VI70_9PEZI